MSSGRSRRSEVLVSAAALAWVLTSACTPPADEGTPPVHEAPGWDVTEARGETREIDFTIDEGTWMTVDVSPDGLASSPTSSSSTPTRSRTSTTPPRSRW